MDAFEKLAKLAGASVESVGEGLPRTRAEALALGVRHYFTGNLCSRGHVEKRYTISGICAECQRQHSSKRYAAGGKEYQRQYKAKPERIEVLRKYQASQAHKDSSRERFRKKTGDDILFAINQSWLYATRGIASSDIIPQCPEPQRSQLQALVDRIKADPQAGKAVVGLLRTMRELRKAELAEMQAGACVEGASSS